MKTTSTLLSTPFLLALLATASPTTTTPATAAGNSASSPSSSAIFVNGTTTTALPLLAAQGDDPIPPGPGQHLRCDTTNKSPGVANIAIAAKWFRDQDANKLCGTNGGNENMHHECEFCEDFFPSFHTLFFLPPFSPTLFCSPFPPPLPFPFHSLSNLVIHPHPQP